MIRLMKSSEFGRLEGQMAELPKKPGSKKYAENVEDPFGTEEPIVSLVKTKNNVCSGKSEISDQSSIDSFGAESYPLTKTQDNRTRAISLVSEKDEMHEFDVDVLHSWEQSSGTISYEAWSSSLVDTLNDAKMLPQHNDTVSFAKLNQRLLHDSMPPEKALTAKSLATLNETMRRDRMQGHLLKRIIVPCKKAENTERYEFLSKMCDDVIGEYMASNNRDNKLLKINLECGGDMPPRLKVNGIRAERLLKYDDDKEGSCQKAQVRSTKHHSFRHLSTCSPPLPYPSANTFGRCSLEDYVKMLKERRKKQSQQ
uniref:Uncharacterized protein n=1 Tax=Elaeophora elaphi TaxID=1147741 RepID=A0A0R3RIP5_9BILA